MSNQTERDAFNAKTVQAASGCIEWTGKPEKFGYGRFCFQGKLELAHRAAWRIFNGPLPPDACVLHHCDNPRCVNPAHLFLGDRGDNARDMAAKGRQWVQRHPEKRPLCPPERIARGEQHGQAKLTEETVRQIRQKASDGIAGEQLAGLFGISASLVSAIVRGRLWKSAGGPIRTKHGNAK